MKRALIIFVTFIAIAALGMAVLIFLESNKTPGMEISEIKNIGIKSPDFVITGKYLAQIEVGYVPGGADKNSGSAIKIGMAKLQDTNSEGSQYWTFPIPSEQLVASHIFAQGISGNYQKTKRIFLDITGETAYYNIIGYSAAKTPTIGIWDNNRIFSYKINDKFKVKLEEKAYPQKNMIIVPLDKILELSAEQPEADLSYYVVGFEARQAGTSTIANGDFIIHINTYLDNGNKIFKNSDFGFSFYYSPADIRSDDAENEYVTGRPLAKVSLARNNFIDTNLSAASFMAGASRDNSVVERCKKISDTEQEQMEDKIINNTLFKGFFGHNIASGKIYDNYGYRAVRDGVCYEMELLLSYGDMAGYQTKTVKEFDSGKALLDLMVMLNSFEIGK